MGLGMWNWSLVILIRELSEEYVNMCMCVSSGGGGVAEM